MRYPSIAAAGFLVAFGGVAVAQTGGSTRGQAPDVSKTDTGATSGSGSGTSTSGGKDANGNQGRDAMPESSIAVRPLDQQGEKPDTPEKSKK